MKPTTITLVCLLFVIGSLVEVHGAPNHQRKSEKEDLEEAAKDRLLQLFLHHFSSTVHNVEEAQKYFKDDEPLKIFFAVLGDEFPKWKADTIRRIEYGDNPAVAFIAAKFTPGNLELDPENDAKEKKDPYVAGNVFTSEQEAARQNIRALLFH